MKITNNLEASQLTTLHIGGSIRQLLETDDAQELLAMVNTLREQAQPYVLIGGGSNLAFPPSAPQLTVIRFLGQSFCRLSDDLIEVEAGCHLSKLINICIKNSCGGLEFLVGIPGTVGGALSVNAGAFGQSLGEHLVSADIIDDQGQVQTWPLEAFAFSYRSSGIRYGREIILRARLRIQARDRQEIRQTVRTHILHRRKHHPIKDPSAGCFFKNPVAGLGGVSAGKLIDACGLKGYACGDLQVSPQHANFIINRGRADLDQLEALCSLIQQEVKAHSGYSLEREVIWIRSDGSKY